MSNILNHNRLPLECRLSMKDYWDFHLRIGREWYGYTKGMQTECLSAYINTTLDECIGDNGELQSMQDYTYDKCINNSIVLEDFGLVGMDNGAILFDKDTITQEEFNTLLKSSHTIGKDDCQFHVYPVGGNNGIYNYSNTIIDFNGVRCSRLNGGFYQGFFRVGDGCSYSILPTDIGEGLSLEFELYRKDLEPEGKTLNVNEQNKGIFFYIGTRAENKWVRYYGNICSEIKADTTEEKTHDGIPVGEKTGYFAETDNKYLIYNRTCEGRTVLDDEKEDKHGETVRIETTGENYPDNLFTVFSRTCGGITTENFEKEYVEKTDIGKYNVYTDLWNNALAFQVTNDNRVGYKYLVRDCQAEKPECSYKIESEFSNTDNVPYAEWTTIHVRIIPSEEGKMILMFYVDGRLVLVSKKLPKLNLRQLNDIPDKQEGVPFNISLGGGTQGLCDVIYEDYQSFYETNYPLQKEFGGSFIGYFKSFKFYTCPLNYSQINQNVNKEMKQYNGKKIYCGALIFNTKPSKTTIEEQTEMIPMLNEFPDDETILTVRMFPNLSKKYVRIVAAVPSENNIEGIFATTTVSGADITPSNITQYFTERRQVLIEDSNYDVWYCSYASPTMINNTVTINLLK